MVIMEEENLKGLLSGWGLKSRPCDTCGVAAALLYCKADAAFLCGGCDSKIHSHNRHERVWMCEVCEQAPAVVTCKADAAALCTACDRDIHSANPLACRHERLPVVPFLDSVADCAARSAIATTTTFIVSDDLAAASAAKEEEDYDGDGDAWLISNLSTKSLMADFLYRDSDLLDFGYDSSHQSMINKIQQLQGSFEHRSFAFADSVVPTQSNGNLSFSNVVNHSFDQNCFDIDFSQPLKHHKQQIISSAFNYSAQHSVSSSDIGIVPDGHANSMSEVSYTFAKSLSGAGVGDGGSSAGTAAPSPVIDREARVLRYREKRKNRKFEKTIRYASRKAYAETRPRIKGRFAKRTETSEGSEMDPIFGSGSTGFLLDHGGYGVVPSF